MGRYIGHDQFDEEIGKIEAPDVEQVPRSRASGGQWEYAAVMSEPGEELEVATGGGMYNWEPYWSFEEARRWSPKEWPIVRRWVPDPGPWEYVTDGAE